jgi:phage terminase Nu1 subunit (DNA packaging protein)
MHGRKTRRNVKRRALTPPAAKPAALTLSDVADLCDVAISTAHGWLKEGLPSSREGRERIIGNRELLKFLAHRQPFAPGSQRDRLANAQAEKFELENARRRGELILANQVADVFATLAADLAARHDGLAGRMANELAGISDPARLRERLLDELRDVRSSFADAIEKLADALGQAPGDGADTAAAPQANRKRVGRRKPRVAARKRRARAVEK